MGAELEGLLSGGSGHTCQWRLDPVRACACRRNQLGVEAQAGSRYLRTLVVEPVHPLRSAEL